MTNNLDLTRNHFELFGLPVRFELPHEAIELTYRDIQARIHPDRYAHASDAERRLSMQWATHVNEAYQTLRSPLKRARYMLELRGVDIGVESNTAMPADFLIAQMEWREAIDEARQAADVDALDSIARRLQSDMRAQYADLDRQLDSERDDHAAAQTVRKLMFLEKVQTEIGEALAEVEG